MFIMFTQILVMMLGIDNAVANVVHTVKSLVAMVHTWAANNTRVRSAIQQNAQVHVLRKRAPDLVSQLQGKTELDILCWLFSLFDFSLSCRREARPTRTK